MKVKSLGFIDNTVVIETVGNAPRILQASPCNQAKGGGVGLFAFFSASLSKRSAALRMSAGIVFIGSGLNKSPL